MPQPHRTLVAEDLRRDLSERALVGGGRSEHFGAWIEWFPVRWTQGRSQPECARWNTRPGAIGLSTLLDRSARRLEIDFTRPGELVHEVSRPARGMLSMATGGQLRYRTASHASPAAVDSELQCMWTELSTELGAAGIALVGLGANPWHGHDELAPDVLDARAQCREAFFAGHGPALQAWRQTARLGLEIDAGNAVRAPARWAWARTWLPLAVTAFACSPCVQGASTRSRAFGSQARRSAGFGRDWIPDEPGRRIDPIQHLLQFALHARVERIAHGDRWVPQLAGLTFAQWLEHGQAGLFPTLEDWRAHYEGLEPPIFARGHLELAGFDSLPMSMVSAVLAWVAALHFDDRAQALLCARIQEWSGDVLSALDRAERDGYSDPGLAVLTRLSFAAAADGLLRLPESFVSRSMRTRFVAFAEHFVESARSPGDELFERFLAGGVLDLAELAEFESAWIEVLRDRNAPLRRPA